MSYNLLSGGHAPAVEQWHTPSMVWKSPQTALEFSHMYMTRMSLFLFLFFFFQGHTPGMWRFPDKGSSWSCSCHPTPQPQRCQIPATSATCIIAHSKARSLTHWARPRIEHASSWIRVIHFHWAVMGTISLIYLFSSSSQASREWFLLK